MITESLRCKAVLNMNYLIQGKVQRILFNVLQIYFDLSWNYLMEFRHLIFSIQWCGWQWEMKENPNRIRDTRTFKMLTWYLFWVWKWGVSVLKALRLWAISMVEWIILSLKGQCVWSGYCDGANVSATTHVPTLQQCSANLSFHWKVPSKSLPLLLQTVSQACAFEEDFIYDQQC